MSIRAMITTPSPYHAPFAHRLEHAADEPTGLRQIRQQAFSRFLHLGMPEKRLERWKYARLNAIEQARFHPRLVTDAPTTTVDLPAWPEKTYHYTLLNGHYRADLSTPSPYITLHRLHDAASLPHLQHWLEEASNGIAALNLAFLDEALVLHLPDGYLPDRPITIRHWNDGGEESPARHTALFITLGRDARATLVEDCSGRGVYWLNHHSHITLAEGASLRHVTLQQESMDACHHRHLEADISAHASYHHSHLNLGADVARLEANLRLNGVEATAESNGLYIASQKQQLEQGIHITHAAPNARSQQHYRGMLGGKAQGIFYGSITVPEDITGSIAHQQSKTMLLSAGAEAINRPELVILNDQVQCSHGAAIGSLDADSLYYLRARGLTEEMARRMMLSAFAGSVLEAWPEDSWKSWCESHIQHALEGISHARHA